MALSGCGFQQRQYTHGYWGGKHPIFKVTSSFENEELKNVIEEKSSEKKTISNSLAPTNDTLITPTSQDTLIDSIPQFEELNELWEGDQTIAKDSLSGSVPYIEEKTTRRAHTSYVAGWIALIFPLLGVAVPYLLSTAFPNQAGWGLLGFLLYGLMQFTAVVAMFIAAVTGYKATQYLESLGIQNQFPEVYEKARKGKKYALIVMSVRLGIFILSGIGFLILISYLSN
jgi:hypothetical protein